MLGYVYFFELNKPVPEGEKAKQILKLSAEDIKSIELTTPQEKIVLLNGEEKWLMTEPYKWRVDKDKFDNLLDRLKELKSDRIVAKGTDIDWKQYGLDKPSHKLLVNLKNGQKRIVVYRL